MGFYVACGREERRMGVQGADVLCSYQLCHEYPFRPLIRPGAPEGECYGERERRRGHRGNCSLYVPTCIPGLLPACNIGRGRENGQDPGADEPETPKYHAPVLKDLHRHAVPLKEPGRMGANHVRLRFFCIKRESPWRPISISAGGIRWRKRGI
jgi:hypothetical protein